MSDRMGIDESLFCMIVPRPASLTYLMTACHKQSQNMDFRCLSDLKGHPMSGQKYEPRYCLVFDLSLNHTTSQPDV